VTRRDLVVPAKREISVYPLTSKRQLVEEDDEEDEEDDDELDIDE
jgi:hypothetical protein